MAWFNTEIGRRTLLSLLAVLLLLPTAFMQRTPTRAADTVAAAAAAPLPTKPVPPISAAGLRNAALIRNAAAKAAQARASDAPKPVLSSATPPTDAEGGTTEGLPIAGYTVKPGDTLTAIAARYGTDVRSVEATNGLTDNSVIQPGQKIVVPTQIGWVYSIVAGDTLEHIATQAGVSPALVAQANHITGNTVLQIGQRLWIPHEPPTLSVQRLAAAGARPSANSSGSSGWGGLSLRWPVTGPITSPFGWRILYGRRDFHDGVDIGVGMHTPVHAAMSGQIILAGWDGPYGIAVEIRNGNVVTLYGHNSYVEVHVGQSVTTGQVISSSGMTGNATGPHVHFGVYINGRAVNPLDFLP